MLSDFQTFYLLVTSASKSLSETRDGLLKTLPSMLNAMVMVWSAWDVKKTSAKKDSISLATCTPLAIGYPKVIKFSVVGHSRCKVFRFEQAQVIKDIGTYW